MTDPENTPEDPAAFAFNLPPMSLHEVRLQVAVIFNEYRALVRDRDLSPGGLILLHARLRGPEFADAAQLGEHFETWRQLLLSDVTQQIVDLHSDREWARDYFTGTGDLLPSAPDDLGHGDGEVSAS